MPTTPVALPLTHLSCPAFEPLVAGATFSAWPQPPALWRHPSGGLAASACDSSMSLQASCFLSALRLPACHLCSFAPSAMKPSIHLLFACLSPALILSFCSSACDGHALPVLPFAYHLPGYRSPFIWGMLVCLPTGEDRKEATTYLLPHALLHRLAVYQPLWLFLRAKKHVLPSAALGVLELRTRGILGIDLPCGKTAQRMAATAFYFLHAAVPYCLPYSLPASLPSTSKQHHLKARAAYHGVIRQHEIGIAQKAIKATRAYGSAPSLRIGNVASASWSAAL